MYHIRKLLFLENFLIASLRFMQDTEEVSAYTRTSRNKNEIKSKCKRNPLKHTKDYFYKRKKFD